MVGYMNTTINNYARKIDNIIYTKKSNKKKCQFKAHLLKLLVK